MLYLHCGPAAPALAVRLLVPPPWQYTFLPHLLAVRLLLVIRHVKELGLQRAAEGNERVPAVGLGSSSSSSTFIGAWQW